MQNQRFVEWNVTEAHFAVTLAQVIKFWFCFTICIDKIFKPTITTIQPTNVVCCLSCDGNTDAFSMLFFVYFYLFIFVLCVLNGERNNNRQTKWKPICTCFVDTNATMHAIVWCIWLKFHTLHLLIVLCEYMAMRYRSSFVYLLFAIHFMLADALHRVF